MVVSIFGKIGGGKTYYTVWKEIIDELVNGYRVIVTNVALDLPELAHYLASHHPNIDPIDLHDRVRILSIDEMGEFFAHREHGVDLEIPTNEEWRKGKNVNYDECKRPVKFVLDEVHVKFDSRGWQSQGPHVTFYISQHRKLDDECVFVSQFPELVDKRLKSFSQEYLYSENHGLTRMFTYFRAPKYFTVSSYLRERTGHNDVSQWVTRFTLNLAVAKCYDTSAGVGIKGRKKPETKRMKGISVFWIFPIIALAIYLGNEAMDRTAKKLSGESELQKKPNQQKPVGQPAGSSVLPTNAQPNSSQPRLLPAWQPISEAVEPSSPLTVTGYVVQGRRIRVSLSDGRTLDETQGILSEVSSTSVVLRDGTVLWVRPKKREQPHVGDAVEGAGGLPVGQPRSGPSSKGDTVSIFRQPEPLTPSKPPEAGATIGQQPPDGGGAGVFPPQGYVLRGTQL